MAIRYTASLSARPDHVQGASEEVLNGCTHVAEDGQVALLNAAARQRLAEHAQAMGLDVSACACLNALNEDVLAVACTLT